MNEGWREAFAPHPVPPWLEAFDGEPVQALDALLRRRFYLGNLQLAESDELLIDWLELLDGTDFPGRLDAAMAEWIDRRWGDRAVSRSSEVLADAWARLLAVVSYANELEQAGAALGPRFNDAHDFLGALSGSLSRDPLGLYLAAVANHQTDRRWAPHWWWMCDLPDAVPYYHAVYAVAGLRGLPPEPGDPGGGFRRDVARAVVRLARAFHRLGEDGTLPKKEAREAFRDVGLLTYSAYPFPARWVETLTAELRRVAEPVGPWLAGLVPGGSPELQKVIRERRAKSTRGRPTAPPRPETWASRGRAIAQTLPSRDAKDLASAEELLREERHHAEHRGDSEPLVRSLCYYASQLVRARWHLARAAAWADEARAWDPEGPYGWMIHGEALKAAGRLDAAERVYRETVERFPQNVVARNGLAEVLKAAGRLEAAEGLYQETVERFPNDAVARTGLAEVLKAAGRLEAAEDVYQETVERFPQNVVARNGLAEVLKAAGRLEAAEGLYQETVEQFPQNVVARNGLAEVLKTAGRLDAAERVYQETVERFPNDAVGRNGYENIRHLRVARGEIEPVAESSSADAPAAGESTPRESLPASEVAEPSPAYGGASEIVYAAKVNILEAALLAVAEPPIAPLGA